MLDLSSYEIACRFYDPPYADDAHGVTVEFGLNVREGRYYVDMIETIG